MTISSPNKYLFVLFLGSYLHGTEMTSFEKTISLFNAGLFFYLLFCLFVFFSYFSQGQSGAALSAEKLRYPAGMIVGSPCTVFSELT